MHERLKIQGQELSPGDIEEIRGLIAANPGWSRWRLSQALATAWDWRNGAGLLKDMAARTLLRKLDERGLIKLPPRRASPPNRMASYRPPPWTGEQTPIECSLKELTPLKVIEASRLPQERALLASALASFHYLGYRGTVGENLQYVIRDRENRPLVFILFGAPAWKCQDRDQFIGWSPAQRQRNLGQITNNTRFLIVPWARVPHLGSCALGRVMRRLSNDWQAKYGHGIDLVETFVERDRFRGTVYKAAGWLRVGATTGRTRQDRYSTIQEPVKDVYVYPLRRPIGKGLKA